MTRWLLTFLAGAALGLGLPVVSIWGWYQLRAWRHRRRHHRKPRLAQRSAK